VYVAGPMGDLPLMNFPAFFLASIRLRDAGYVPVNPAEYDMSLGLDPSRSMESQDWSRDVSLQRDFVLIERCMYLALLDGWEGSEGATRESEFASTCGIDVYPLEDFCHD
jgi:hypothetical protein